MINSNSLEYIIDKNYIYKNPSEEIKELLKEKEKIKLVVHPKYVSYGFLLAKDLNKKGIANFDEELKIERDFKDGKRKTKIYISLRRKSDNNEYLIGKEHFYENIYENIKNYLKTHDKIKIVAKQGEVGIAFRVAEKLVSQGIALYDEELQLSRNYKIKGSTKVYISLKKNRLVKEYVVKNDAQCSDIMEDMKQLFKKHEKIDIIALPKVVNTAFKAAKKLVEEKYAIYDEELKIRRNFKDEKGRTKIYISLKRKASKCKTKEFNTINIQKNIPHNEILQETENLLKKNDRVNLIAKTTEVGLAFKIAEELYKKGVASYDEELKIERNYKEGKGNTKAIISLKKITNLTKDKKMFKEEESSNLINMKKKDEKGNKSLDDKKIKNIDEMSQIKEELCEGNKNRDFYHK